MIGWRWRRWKRQIELNVSWGVQLQKVSLELMNSLGEWNNSEQEKCFEALNFCINAHSNQKRKSGEPYAIHPVAVAQKAFELGLDADCVVAALLHDVVEDTDYTLEQIEQKFGAKVSSMVNALTKIDALNVSGALSANGAVDNVKVATLRKMLLAMSQDMRVIVIKLCDRWHNLKTIKHLKIEKQLIMIKETEEIYAPLASRLGMNGLWSDLKEMCFLAKYKWRAPILSKALDFDRNHEKGLIESSIKKIEEALSKEHIKAQVSGRHKSLISIYEKMKEKKLLLKEVLDREGARIIVKEKKECYIVIGIIHELWKPIPGMFKDYIALPKMNGYQSLHTAVLTENGTPLEIQVRTLSQHQMAEEGVAAHWHYKTKSEPSELQQKWSWLQSLLDIQASTAHSDDFLEHVRTDLFSDEVYVFSPEGEVIALPRGAGVLDFAFAIHSDIGMHAGEFFVNGHQEDISFKLKNGDKVEVKTRDDVQIEAVWLSWVRTGKAKSYIRNYLKTNKKDEAKYLALELVSHALMDLGIDRVREDERIWEKAVKSFSSSEEELCLKIVLGKISALSVAQKIAKNSEQKGGNFQKKPILISGEDGEHVKMAHCCAPLPPIDVIGILAPEEGLVVHKKDCKDLQALSSHFPRIQLQWEPKALANSFNVHVQVKSKNERGALAQIAAVIAKESADINSVSIKGKGGQSGGTIIDFEVQVRSKFHLDQIVGKIRSLENTMLVKI